MDNNTTRLLALKTYLSTILTELNINYNAINIDYLSDDVDTYSLDKLPTNSTVERWISGVSLYRDVYSFRSRKSYSQDEINNLENIGFFEDFERKIREKNDAHNLPLIDGIQSIECLNCGTLISQDDGTAEFDIQLQINYIDN